MNTFEQKILFEKFDVIKILKKDEHTAVYLAHHIYLDKQIILKVLNTKTIGEKRIINRFKREAKILALFNSENIIKVLDFGMFKEFFYISFEYFPSKNLREIITENLLSDEDKEKIVIQILKGLQTAHNYNIIHRDIKPENILVNKLCEVKVGDFGLAVLKNDSFDTNKYSLVGTPSYMSPEQINGKELTIKSDLFSVGIVIYELYSGSNPFLGEDINKSISLITKFDDSNNNLKLGNIPENIKVIIEKLLRKNPDNRFTNITEALKVLGVNYEKKAESKSLKQNLSKNKSVLSILFVTVLIAIFYFLYFSNNNTSKETTLKKENSNLTISHQDTLLNKTKKKDELFIPSKDEEEVKNENIKNDYVKKKNSNILPIEKKDGELFVECLPWGDIYINNKKFETTPIKKSIKLLEGKYELRLVHPDYPVFIDSIKISPTELLNISVKLDTLFGFLDCKVFPWGEVYIDDVYKGETPFVKPIILKPKQYLVEIKNPKYFSMKKTIIITKGDTLKLVQNFNDKKAN